MSKIAKYDMNLITLLFILLKLIPYLLLILNVFVSFIWDAEMVKNPTPPTPLTKSKFPFLKMLRKANIK